MTEGLLNRFGRLHKKAGDLTVRDVDVLKLECNCGFGDSSFKKELKNSRIQELKAFGGEGELGVGAGKAAVGAHFGIVSQKNEIRGGTVYTQ